MRKVILLVMLVLGSFSLVACDTSTTPTPKPDPIPQPQPQPQPEPEPEPEPQPEYLQTEISVEGTYGHYSIKLSIKELNITKSQPDGYGKFNVKFVKGKDYTLEFYNNVDTLIYTYLYNARLSNLVISIPDDTFLVYPETVKLTKNKSSVNFTYSSTLINYFPTPKIKLYKDTVDVSDKISTLVTGSGSQTVTFNFTSDDSGIYKLEFCQTSVSCSTSEVVYEYTIEYVQTSNLTITNNVYNLTEVTTFPPNMVTGETYSVNTKLYYGSTLVWNLDTEFLATLNTSVNLTLPYQILDDEFSKFTLVEDVRINQPSYLYNVVISYGYFPYYTGTIQFDLEDVEVTTNLPSGMSIYRLEKGINTGSLQYPNYEYEYKLTFNANNSTTLGVHYIGVTATVNMPESQFLPLTRNFNIGLRVTN